MITLPRVKATIESGDDVPLVQLDFRDVMAFERESLRNHWGTLEQSPVTFLIVGAWAALRRTSQLPAGCADVKAWMRQVRTVEQVDEDGNPVEGTNPFAGGVGEPIDPTQPDPSPGTESA